MVTSKIPTQAEMVSSITTWSRKLRESKGPTVEKEQAACAALDAIDLAVAALPGGQTVEQKREIREHLWSFRMALPADANPAIRESYEKLRNLTLDNTVERVAKGGRIPTSHFTTHPPATDIPNFQVVSEQYLRGGQPDQDGLGWLTDAGVRSLIDLRGDDRDNQWHPPTWSSIKTFEVDVKDFGTPTIETVEKFLSIVDNPANQPVFVHCKAGVGRTGVMTACWNIAHGMTAEEALKQESINSYHGSLHQEAFVREFETYWQSKQTSLVDNAA